MERYAARRWQSKLQKKNKDEDEEIVIVRFFFFLKRIKNLYFNIKNDELK